MTRRECQRDDSNVVWRAFEQMPVLHAIRGRFCETQALQGARVAVVFHLTKEAACLAITLRSAGADVRFIPSKTATIERCVAQALTDEGIPVPPSCDERQRAASIRDVAAFAPQLVVDNADVFTMWHNLKPSSRLMCASVHSRGACDIVEAYWKTHHHLLFPVIAVGSSPLKLSLESTHGTGQSVVAAIIQVTGLQLGGKAVVVVGYGNVGSGVAHFARGLNARVCVVQKSPLRALAAVMDGFEVLPLAQALSQADVVVTATGSTQVLSEKSFALLKDGVFIGNIGRTQEIDVPALSRIGNSVRKLDENLTEYRLDGKRILLMGDGHQFNHMAGCANSSEIMDLSLSLHALILEYVWGKRPVLSDSIHDVPSFLEDKVVRAKLTQLGIQLDS